MGCVYRSIHIQKQVSVLAQFDHRLNFYKTSASEVLAILKYLKQYLKCQKDKSVRVMVEIFVNDISQKFNLAHKIHLYCNLLKMSVV